MNAKELQCHAMELARSHQTTRGSRRDRLVDRLNENARSLRESYGQICAATDRRETVPESVTWLLDNRYFLEEHVRAACDEMSGKYSRGLPQLRDGPQQGFPRIYAVAVELLRHLDGRASRKRLHAFISAYQECSPLTLGELWATPIMLRMAAIEALGRVARRVARRMGPWHTGQDQDRSDDVRAIRNGIAWLRALGALDWKQFVETESVVDQILRRDPAGIYEQMDFESRDRYRHVVEGLARRCSLPESAVAQCVLEFAQGADGLHGGDKGSRTRREAILLRHVGYYLVDRGLPALKKKVGYRCHWRELPARAASHAPLAWYLGGILSLWLLTVAGAAAAAWHAGAAGLLGAAGGVLLLSLFAGAAGQLAVSLVNWVCTLVVPPRPVMRLDFSRGIPSAARTLVAVPALLANDSSVRTLVEQLELRYLANRDRNLLFALLTDLPDAPRRTLPDDRRLLRLARKGIERLNRRYRRGGQDVFYLLHRPRKWNPQQGAWMGEERKRGKLAALNRLLMGGAGGDFSFAVGDLNGLDGVRYVITLDADTQLPPQVAHKLVGAMVHPLNWPELDARTQTVTEGYAILQPRTGATISEARRSLFSGLLAPDAGIDPYTRQASDVYQDLFARGSFIGKGIYDVRVFEEVLGGRLPDNRILSHDLIEGCFAGSGVLSDVELFEGIPAGFLGDASRRHRWIRGDWQIASWLLPRAPSPHGKARNPLRILARWKIFDNLRRSLTPPLLLAFLVAGWILAPAMAAFWTLSALVLATGPAMMSALLGFLRRPPKTPWRIHLAHQGRGWLRTFCSEAVAWCVLPYAAYSNIDAIVRTVYRVAFSHRNLLEWTTAGDAEARAAKTCAGHYAAMWPCAAAAFVLTIALAAAAGRALPFAGPTLALWLLGPMIAWRISRPRRATQPRLTGKASLQFRRWARQTWHYFEENVGPEHHWLAPDNVQESPHPMVAHRTSPTNIGMSLLADLAACDLGYLPVTALLDRAGHTFETLGRLKRYRGHFLNWYDTRTLEPAEPRYVSSVDSGNLWGAMTVFRAGLDEMRDRPLVPPRVLEGLQDALHVIAELRTSRSDSTRDDAFDTILAKLRNACDPPLTGGVQQTCLQLCRIRALAASLASAAVNEPPSVQEWTHALVTQSAAVHRDIAQLAFWTRFPKLARRSLAMFGSSDPPAGPTAAPDSADSGPSGIDWSQPGDGGRSLRVMESSSPSAAVKQRDRAFRELFARIGRMDRGCSVRQVAAGAQRTADRISRLLDVAAGDETDRDSSKEIRALLEPLQRAAEGAAAAAREQLRQISVLKRLCREFCRMDFRFLYHPNRRLLAIGFNVDRQVRDDSYYGLFASEARLTSFLAVSHGQLPLEHWFSLGRMITLVDSRPVLLSWSGSLFEHLMPLLLMPSTSGTLLDSSCRRAVRRQIRYARGHSIPWGISESCHRQINGDLAYQYRMFGVPGLGLMRGLDAHLVVAPYASALASMLAPRQAAKNLARLEQSGCLGPQGFYDAIDYTQPSPTAATDPMPCRTVMAHHSGMTLLALTNVLLNGPMPRRFLKTGLHAAHGVLLQERWPHAIRPITPE